MSFKGCTMLYFDVAFHKATGFEFLLKIYRRIFFHGKRKIFTSFSPLR